MVITSPLQAHPLLPFTSSCLLPRSQAFPSPSPPLDSHSSPHRCARTSFAAAAFLKKETLSSEPAEDVDRFKEDSKNGRVGETFLYSFAPYPLFLLSTLPGAGIVRSLFGPFVELVKTWNLPEWLVHWGHPGNMAVVLFAMGGYGTYLGFRIRLSKDPEEKAMAKDLHPKLLAGMFFFFALGATGGITALLTSDKPIFESPHAVTGLIGLSLLTVQTILPTLFEENPGLRTVHGLLGSSIMTLFLIHAALGLQLGLSF
ncbi:putative di-heme cytochrome, transmembrane [Dioscorea sansibarensis]